MANIGTVYYDASSLPIREDIIFAHQRAWKRLSRPGTWWSGAQRVSIATEARHANNCGSCRKLQSALTPEAVSDEHDSLGHLPAPVVEAIHRIWVDASRLTGRWYEKLISSGLADGEYVEIVGIVATVIAVDTFTHALGLTPHPLPFPEGGQPSRLRPPGAKAGLAWVPTVSPEDVTDTELGLYSNSSGAHIRRALSLVPDEAIGFFDLDEAHYLPYTAVRDFGYEYRAISHAQIELLAARVSALNKCFY